MSEIKLQSTLFLKVWNELPQTRYLFFHVPNGGKRSKIEAMQLKASGVIAGIPDMLLIWNGILYAFELKTEIGKLSASQIELHKVWTKHNIKIEIIRDVNDGFNKIKSIVSR